MPQLSEDRSTVNAVKKVVVLIRLDREASVIIKNVMDPLLTFRVMGDPNGFCVACADTGTSFQFAAADEIGGLNVKTL